MYIFDEINLSNQNDSILVFERYRTNPNFNKYIIEDHITQGKEIVVYEFLKTYLSEVLFGNIRVTNVELIRYPYIIAKEYTKTYRGNDRVYDMCVAICSIIEVHFQRETDRLARDYLLNQPKTLNIAS